MRTLIGLAAFFVCGLLVFLIADIPQKKSVDEVFVDTPAGYIPISPDTNSAEVESNSYIKSLFLPSGGCLSEEQLASHPLVAEEVARLAPFSTTLSEDISSYRGLPEDELRPLIQQGDSAAMAVMGAIEVMRAWGQPDSRAVPYLMLEGGSFLSMGPIPDDQTQHYERATAWFYEAALHGRVLALTNLGNLLTFQGKTPVQLGWVSEEESASMTKAQNSVLVANVYEGLVYTIAPELEFGLSEGDGFLPGARAAQRYAEIIKPLYEKFEEDRIQRGLPSVEVPDSKLPSLREVELILCEQFD